VAAIVFLLFLLFIAISIGVGVGVGVTQSGSGGGGSSTIVDGSCGFADGIVTNSTPSANLLYSAGTATLISGAAPWAWDQMAEETLLVRPCKIRYTGWNRD